MRLLFIIPYLLVSIYPSEILSHADFGSDNNSTSDDGLYLPTDGVLIVNGQNISDAIYSKPYAVLLEFYRNGCGDCQRFAPTWKALAQEIKGWNRLLVIAAIDGEVDENVAAMRDFEILKTPTIRYFYENYKKGEENIGTDIKGPKVNGTDYMLMPAVKDGIIKQIIEEQRAGRAQQFPNLIPYAGQDGESVWEKLKSMIDGKGLL